MIDLLNEKVFLMVYILVTHFTTVKTLIVPRTIFLTHNWFIK